MTTTVTVRIADLLRDSSLQVRRKLNEGAIHQYASAYRQEVTLPPIKVAVVNGVEMVVDGWHRLAALESIGRKDVEAEVMENITMEDARWMAAQANLTHGVPLKPKELRNVFKVYVTAKKYLDEKGRLKSYRQIAQELGGKVDHCTVRNWMKTDFRRLFDMMGGQEPQRGPKDAPPVNPQDHFATTAREAAQSLKAVARGVTCPDTRGELIALLEETVMELKSTGPWNPIEF